MCKVCGFNIIGHYPNNCPFCGASKENFISAEECSREYKIVKKRVNDNVHCLTSEPALGLEHNAYKIKTKSKIIWIDCPSTFSKKLEPSEINLFTHHHFIAAANLYKNYFANELWIHINDSNNYIANKYNFDNKFETKFNLNGIEAYHIDGHTQGFTFYIFNNALFVCDYVFITDERIKFNPYGPYKATLKGARKLKKIVRERGIEHVCGFDYVMDYDNWNRNFISLLD